jgi:hypothetical protein
MLATDSVTVAVEVPIYLSADDLEYFKRTSGFDVPIPDDVILTGHIDFLQVRHGAIHIVDYKPGAKSEKPIPQLMVYALALSRRTGLRLYDFVCSWFDVNWIVKSFWRACSCVNCESGPSDGHCQVASSRSRDVLLTTINSDVIWLGSANLRHSTIKSAGYKAAVRSLGRNGAGILLLLADMGAWVLTENAKTDPVTRSYRKLHLLETTRDLRIEAHHMRASSVPTAPIETRNCRQDT